ncbi:hypothetical protein EW146_g5382 [Bondarzewia mesenterica]|uniref:RlpA-like protein double-psi beta-barrel domain-containing protein n=1 Tax=Bondarzewia mesenterica TaxID=1095465 RepID=A0A4S4LRK7_9AGAM|nr:hypothetical protein EW146_g5382 [Bondarzewia mesenterica]
MVALTRFAALVSVFTVGSALATPASVVRRSYSGEGTLYEPGAGACGFNNHASDLVVAVSYDMFGAGNNPTNNPICGKEVTVSFQGKSVTAKVMDRCAACNVDDLDLSPGAFQQLADPSLERIAITWDFA